TLPVRLYSANAARGTLWHSLRTACREVHAARGVIWRLFVRDFAVQFRQKLLGYAWAFLAPLLSVASFVFLSALGVLRPGDTGIPYPLFVFMGVGLWGLLLAVLQSVAGGLIQHGDLVMRTSVPRIGLALSGLGTVIYAQVIHIVTSVSLLVCF